MSILNFNDYKLFLTAIIESKPRGFQSSLAKAIGCQASYLIQVLSKKNELTEDQGIKAAQYLKLSKEELEYFLLLLGLSRATSVELKNYYSQKIAVALKFKNDIRKNVPHTSEIQKEIAIEYFSNWDIPIIHLATSIPFLQEAITISNRLKLDIKRVEYVLNFLNLNKLVEFKKNKWIFSGDPIFLPKQSPLNLIHQTNQRNQIARSLRELSNEDIHFCSTFVISAKQFEEIKKEIRSLIESSHRNIVSSPSEEIYSLVIDLFKVV